MKKQLTSTGSVRLSLMQQYLEKTKEEKYTGIDVYDNEYISSMRIDSVYTDAIGICFRGKSLLYPYKNIVEHITWEYKRDFNTVFTSARKSDEDFNEYINKLIS